MSTKPPRAIVVAADPHGGSSVGLMPPGFINTNHNEIKQNELQKWLWRCWVKTDAFIYEKLGDSPFAFVVNGDVTEGVHHGTKELISLDPADHVKCAELTLAPIANRAVRVFFVKGTECHTGSHEATLGTIFNADRDPSTHKDHKMQGASFDRLTIDIAGIRCVWAHHIGASTRSYTEATQFAVAINEEQINAARNGEVIPRVIGRAHRHRFGMFENHNALCLVSAPWQGLTRHGHKVVTAERPHPGIYILDWRNRANGELPEVHRVTYGTPHPKAIQL